MTAISIERLEPRRLLSDTFGAVQLSTLPVTAGEDGLGVRPDACPTFASSFFGVQV